MDHVFENESAMKLGANNSIENRQNSQASLVDKNSPRNSNMSMAQTKINFKG